MPHGGSILIALVIAVSSYGSAYSQLKYCDNHPDLKDARHHRPADIYSGYWSSWVASGLPLGKTVLSHSRLNISIYSGKSTGGDDFLCQMDGVSLLPGEVYDHFNGSYTCSIWTGADPGVYNVSIKLMYANCEALHNCRSDRSEKMPTTQSVYNYVLYKTTVQVSMNPMVQFDGTRKTGRWVKTSFEESENLPSRLKGPYRWKDYRDPNRLLYPEEHGFLWSDKWIHFAGNSMSRVFYQEHIKYFRIVKNARCSHYTRPGHDDHLVEAHNTRIDYCYIPKLNLTLSNMGNGPGLIVTDINATFSSNEYFAVLRSMVEDSYTHRFSSIPDLLMYNFGLHFTTKLTSPEAVTAYGEIVQATLRGFQTELSPRGTILYWRNSAPTHWPDNSLSPFHNCYTMQRLRCQNEAIDALISSPEFSGVWGYFDFWELGLLRPDCSKDNRHYRWGNCSPFLLSKWFHQLDKEAPGLTP